MNTAGLSGAQGIVIDRQTFTIRMERRVESTPARVFEAWTQPEQVAAWWDPAGERLVVCEIDLRPGGAFSFASRSHRDMPFAGIYREIVAPERLVFDAMGATGRVLLEEAAGGTHMAVEITCQSTEHLDQFMKMGVHEGTSRTLDNLVGYAREGALRSTI